MTAHVILPREEGSRLLRGGNRDDSPVGGVLTPSHWLHGHGARGLDPSQFAERTEHSAQTLCRALLVFKVPKRMGLSLLCPLELGICSRRTGEPFREETRA